MRKPAVTRPVAAALAAVLACAALLWGAERASAQTSRSRTTTPQAKEGGGKPWLGVYTQDVGEELREALDLSGGGALVTRVVDGSPAERAGIKRRDYIVSFNGQGVDEADALAGLVQKARVGQTVSVEVIRDGERQTLSVKLAARPSESGEDKDEDVIRLRDQEVVVPDVDGESFHMNIPELGDAARVLVRRYSSRGRLGVRVEDLSADLAPYFNAREAKGALVLEVMDDTPAKKVGLKAGDVIVQVGDKEVSDSEDLIRALRDKEGATKVTVLRKGSRMTLEPELEKIETMGLRAPAIRRQLMGPQERNELRDELRRLRDELREMRERLDKLEKD